MGKRIGILGAGWCGVPLAEHFKTLGHEVTLITRQTLPEIKFENFDGLISTWPRDALASFQALPSNLPLIAMSSVGEYPELRSFEETLAKQFSHLTILRLGGLIGYDRHPGKFLSGKKNLSGKNHPTNLLHRDDLIQILSSLVKLEVWPTQTFVVTCDDHPSRKSFYTEAAKALNLPLPHFTEADESEKLPQSNTVIKNLLRYTFMFASPFDYLKVLRERKDHDSKNK